MQVRTDTPESREEVTEHRAEKIVSPTSQAVWITHAIYGHFDTG